MTGGPADAPGARGALGSDARSAGLAGMLCAAAMIAQQVGAKATRDALFLSSFPVTRLPEMMMASAVAAVAFVPAASALLARRGPGRVVPAAFAGSGCLLLAEWGLARVTPGAAAVAVYLHVSALALLGSGFWSLLSERFDPRSARTWMARITSAGTLGGILGAVVSERAAALGGVAAALPVLALLHFCCAAACHALARQDGPPHIPAPAGPWPFELLARDPLLRSLGLLVLAGSVAATLVDYVFKSQAAASLQGPELMGYFATFYAAVGLLAFGVQVTLGRLSLERLGLAGSVATLPSALLAGGLLSFAVPGLAGAGAWRGAEAVLRGSLYRLGYELLYTPVPTAHKRRTKAFVDVALDRLGEAAGGGLVRITLLAAPGSALGWLALLAGGLGLAGLVLCGWLRRGYVRALEQSLLSQQVDLEQTGVLDGSTRTTALHLRLASPALTTWVPLPGEVLDTGLLRIGSVAEAATASPAVVAGPPPPADPVVARLIELRSRDEVRVSRALAVAELEPRLVPQAILLLAWDAVWPAAAEALRRVANQASGQLCDALLDPDAEFAIRRRVPRVLRKCPSQRTVDGLLLGLDDVRFEVRFACARAVVELMEAAPELRVEAARIVALVLREAAAARPIWESRVLLDQPDDEGRFLTEALQDRVSRSLEHVFTLLALVLPRRPLGIAFRGLHTDDQRLRGTALEYLDSVLPGPVREQLWPFLGDGRGHPPAPRPAAEVADELLRSHPSIELRLQALKAAKP